MFRAFRPTLTAIARQQQSPIAYQQLRFAVSSFGILFCFSTGSKLKGAFFAVKNNKVDQDLCFLFRFIGT